MLKECVFSTCSRKMDKRLTIRLCFLNIIFLCCWYLLKKNMKEERDFFTSSPILFKFSFLLGRRGTGYLC